MIVVSDTGPLNYLTLIGHLEILPALYGRSSCRQRLRPNYPGFQAPIR